MPSSSSVPDPDRRNATHASSRAVRASSTVPYHSVSSPVSGHGPSPRPCIGEAVGRDVPHPPCDGRHRGRIGARIVGGRHPPACPPRHRPAVGHRLPQVLVLGESGHARSLTFPHLVEGPLTRSVTLRAFIAPTVPIGPGLAGAGTLRRGHPAKSTKPAGITTRGRAGDRARHRRQGHIHDPAAVARHAHRVRRRRRDRRRSRNRLAGECLGDQLRP